MVQGTVAMIQTITRREYSVACDGCGAAGPAAESRGDAGRLVRDLGWQSLKPIPSFDFLTTWLCPTCQNQRDSAAIVGK
jgi:hypothetical protein